MRPRLVSLRGQTHSPVQAECGCSPSVYCETAAPGVQAQARAEVHAQKKGLPRPGLMVTQAIEGLQIELESIGLVYPREVITAKRREVSDVPVMTAIYAVQETVANEPG